MGYIYPCHCRPKHLPGRGLLVVKMADGLRKSHPLHYGWDNSSISLRGACTSEFVAAGAHVRAAPTLYMLHHSNPTICTIMLQHLCVNNIASVHTSKCMFMNILPPIYNQQFHPLGTPNARHGHIQLAMCKYKLA